MNESVIVVGGGGHAKVVVSTLLALNIKIEAIVDDDERKWDRRIFDIPVQGRECLDDRTEVRGVIAVGDNDARRRIRDEMPYAKWESIVHPQAYVHPSASIGAGTVIFAGAVIQPDVVIGEHCIINTNASIDHDCVIGDFAHIAPGSCLAGDVSVGEGAFLGIGGAVIVGRKIGKWSVVGAGAAVTEDIPDDTTAVGVPARVTRHHYPKRSLLKA